MVSEKVDSVRILYFNDVIEIPYSIAEEIFQTIYKTLGVFYRSASNN